MQLVEFIITRSADIYLIMHYGLLHLHYYALWEKRYWAFPIVADCNSLLHHYRKYEWRFEPTSLTAVHVHLLTSKEPEKTSEAKETCQLTKYMNIYKQGYIEYNRVLHHYA